MFFSAQERSVRRCLFTHHQCAHQTAPSTGLTFFSPSLRDKLLLVPVAERPGRAIRPDPVQFGRCEVRGAHLELENVLVTRLRRILVVGGTGMLGHVSVRVLRSGFDVQATVRAPDSVDPSVLGVPLHHLDALAGPYSIEAALDAANPDVVLNCIGMVKQLPQASDPVVAIAINSLFPHQLTAACERRAVRLIHVSTDCVFSGRLEPPARYVEEDEPDALDLYGRSKFLGEVTDTTALTLRTSIIGPELERTSGLLAWLQSHAGKQIQGYRNSIFSGLTTHALVGLLADVIAGAPELRGLYHLSTEPISKLDLISQLNDHLGLGCSIQPVDGPTINRALDSNRFQDETGLEVPDWTTMVTELSQVCGKIRPTVEGRP